MRKALAASIALPTVVRPIVIDDKVLVDGGATNPLPFDRVARPRRRGGAGRYLGRAERHPPRHAEPTGRRPATHPRDGHAITAEKLKHGAPDLIVRPNVGMFRTLDFFQASAILRASEPAKAEIKERLAALLSDSAHVAALGIVERVGGEIDPAGGGEVADRDRLLPLQRDHEDLAVLGGFALHEGDALDLEAAADDGLERLLFLRAGGARLGEQERGDGKRSALCMNLLLGCAGSARMRDCSGRRLSPLAKKSLQQRRRLGSAMPP